MEGAKAAPLLEHPPVLYWRFMSKASEDGTPPGSLPFENAGPGNNVFPQINSGRTIGAGVKIEIAYEFIQIQPPG